jgi:RNA polymerase sigma-70 factor (ECF subfamily)
MGEAEPPPVSVPGQFEVFYAENYASVVALMGALCRSGGVAEDLAQEAFLRAHRDWEHVRGLDAPIAWVRRVAINLSRSRFRRLRSEAAALLRMNTSRPTLQALPSQDEAFWDEVRNLPKRQSQAVALRYVDDLSVREIAQVMNAAEGTVRALLHQGRERLERQLTAKGLIGL